MPALLARSALGIPRNDDWSYLLTTFRFAEHGRWYGQEWIGKTFVAQALVGAPLVRIFGRDVTVLHLAVAAAGVVGLLGVVDLARRCLDPARARFVGLVTAATALWAILVVTFMTDVPALVLSTWCLALGVRSIGSERLRRGTFVAALALGAAAVGIRDYAVVAPLVVVGVAGWARRDRADRRVVMLGAAATLAGAAALIAWTRGLPGWAPNTPVAPDAGVVVTAGRLALGFGVLLGILVAPAVVRAGPVGIVRAAWRTSSTASIVVGITVGAPLLVAAIVRWGTSAAWGPGNLVRPEGPPGLDTAAGTWRPDLIGDGPRLVVALVGVASATVLALAVVAAWGPARRALRDPRRDRVAGALVVGLTAVLVPATAVASASTEWSVAFDRYLLPAVAPVAILVLLVGERVGAPIGRSTITARWAGSVALGIAFGFGWLLAADGAAMDAARWRVTERAAARFGLDAVDGGFEWTDFRARREVWASARPARCVVVYVERAVAHPRAPVVEVVQRPLGVDAEVVARRIGPCAEESGP